MIGWLYDPPMSAHHHPESGNLFFYIFMAVILFASLTFVVAQGNRGSVEGLAAEQARLNATEIIDFGDAVARAVGTLRLRGTMLAQLRFSDAALTNAWYGAPDPANSIHHVFHADGGAIIYRNPPSAAITSGGANRYDFIGNIVAEGNGLDCLNAECADIMMIVPGISADVCRTANILLGVHDRNTAVPEETTFTANGYFAGTPGYAGRIGAGVGSLLAGRNAACFRDQDSGLYYFYRVLWAQ